MSTLAQNLSLLQQFTSVHLKVPITLFHTAEKMKFSIKDFCNKCDKIRRKLWIWSHLLKKSLMENFIFCAVSENYMVYRSLSHPSRNISDSSDSRIYQNSLVSHPNISEAVSQSTTSNTVLWKCIAISFKWVYINCFNKIRFLAKISSKLQKNVLFWTM